MEESTRLQKAEERLCDCTAVGSGEGHADWCKAKKFDTVPSTMSAADALTFLKIEER